MDNLEKQLLNLPQPKLSKQVDFKIKFKIYRFLLLSKIQKFGQTLFYPHSLLARVMVASLIAIIFLGSTAVYAVSNDHITSGHTLYPLKKTIENVEQQLSLTKSAKVDTLNKLSARRLKEAVNLAQDDLSDSQAKQAGQVEPDKINSDNIQQTITEAVDNLDAAITTSEQIQDNKKAKKAKNNIKKQNEATAKYLDNIDNMAKQNNDAEVLKKVSEAKQKIDKYQQRLDQEDKDDDVIKSQSNYKNKAEPKENKDNNSSNEQLKNEPRSLDGNNTLNGDRED